MPTGGVSRRAALRAWAEERFERVVIRDATLVAGADDTIAVASGDVGEAAAAEVGSDGILGDYVSLVTGQPPMPLTGETTRAKPELDLETNANAEAPAGTEIAYGGRKSGERGKPVNRWVSVADYESDSGPAKRYRDPIEPRFPIILDGESFVILFRNEASSVTPGFSNSTYEVPVLVWDGNAPWR